MPTQVGVEGLSEDARRGIGSITIRKPVNGSTRIILSSQIKMRIDGAAYVCTVGDLDCEVNINGTPVTGLSALDVNTVAGASVATAANIINVGDELTIDITNASSPTEPENFTLTFNLVRIDT